MLSGEAFPPNVTAETLDEMFAALKKGKKAIKAMKVKDSNLF